jgi:hypothetical protein
MPAVPDHASVLTDEFSGWTLSGLARKFVGCQVQAVGSLR